MILIKSEPLFVAVHIHKWQRPKIYSVDIPIDWRETMICFGFGTIHYERTV